MEPHPETRAFELTAVYPGVEIGEVRQKTGWSLAVRDKLEVRLPPSAHELAALRDLKARSDAAHRRLLS